MTESEPLLERVELFRTMAGTPAPPRVLKAGAFYWVLLKSLLNEFATQPNCDWQPARFTGQSADVAVQRRPGPTDLGTPISTWDCLGFNAADGHHSVEVIGVGPEIVDPRPSAVEVDVDTCLAEGGPIDGRMVTTSKAASETETHGLTENGYVKAVYRRHERENGFAWVFHRSELIRRPDDAH